LVRQRMGRERRRRRRSRLADVICEPDEVFEDLGRLGKRQMKAVLGGDVEDVIFEEGGCEL
jgi:hypothetical protein